MSSTPWPETTSALPHPRSPLVGRARERVFLQAELAFAVRGHGRLVLLGGEAGIGKTALAHDLVPQAEEAGARVIAGHCYDLTNTPPYGPWLELFLGNRDDPGWPALPAAFQEGRLGRVMDQSALFADVHRFIGELAAIRPVYILLEDLHWADPAILNFSGMSLPSSAGCPSCLLLPTVSTN